MNHRILINIKVNYCALRLVSLEKKVFACRFDQRAVNKGKVRYVQSF